MQRDSFQPGNFSLSLSVKDIAAAKTFYGHLGFEPMHGDEDQGWLILMNGDCKIGLFQGMFPNNTLTFNPGWDSKGEALPEFTDIRELQQQLKDAGIEMLSEVESESGPGSFMITDPDGNPILFDQHV